VTNFDWFEKPIIHFGNTHESHPEPAPTDEVK
jgi:hypothetical protein